MPPALFTIILRIGLEMVLQGNTPAKRIVSGKRVRTVIQNFIHFAGHFYISALLDFH